MVGQQHIQAAQTGLWQALKSGSIHTIACLRILVEQAKTYGSLCYFTSYFTSIKC